MKKLSFVLAALLVTGVAFADKNCKKGAAGKACCKKEASSGGKACCKKDGATASTSDAKPVAVVNGGTPAPAAASAKACCKKSASCSKDAAAKAHADAPATQAATPARN